jgi:uncharacterized LabA/DUF88 family protein
MSEQLAVFIDFENVALWAEQEFFDFEVTTLIEYLQTRGPAVVKRAYGDWSRFSRYRDELMNNSIDLIQIYSVRAGKNRADIRMAIDAFEVAVTRSKIQTFVIVSGDSDFGPLVAKLREYGHYTLGIGPRSITHELLVHSCDEFIYMETILGEVVDIEDPTCLEIEQARGLLKKALQAHGKRGEIPVLATQLKQTMLLIDPAFNEANFGFSQFKDWLEDHNDLVKIFIKDLQLFVAPSDYITSGEIAINQSSHESPNVQVAPQTQFDLESKKGLSDQYRQIISRTKTPVLDLSTRRDVLRDIYRELNDPGRKFETEELLNLLSERYETQGYARSKNTLTEIIQLASRQRAFEQVSQNGSHNGYIKLASDVDSEAIFVGRAEADLVYTVIRSGVEIDPEELAYLLINDRNQADYIHSLLDDLERRDLIIYKANRYCLPGRSAIPFINDPALQILCQDIQEVDIPKNLKSGAETARSMAKKAMVQRSQDFAASSKTSLLACRIQWEAVEQNVPGATLGDLRWYMASYASAQAGKLSQVDRDYVGARPYYLAFFTLVQEDDPLWGRMRGLINPMLAYYWANAARELNINVTSWNENLSSPAQIAVLAATHSNPELRERWLEMTIDLAQVNHKLLSRIANQLTMRRSDDPANSTVAEQIQEVLSNIYPA